MNTLGVTTAEEDISVIAKVKNVDAWNAIPGVHQTNDISMAPDKSGRIITAKVSITELDNILQSPGVLSLKATQPVRPSLKKQLKRLIPEVIFYHKVQ